jgi:hypothetical protein
MTHPKINKEIISIFIFIYKQISPINVKDTNQLNSTMKEDIVSNKSHKNNIQKQCQDINGAFISKDGQLSKTRISNKTLPEIKQKKRFFKAATSRILGDIYATDDPQLYSSRRKNAVVLLVALIGINGSISSLIYMPGILQMADDLNVSLPAIDGTVSAYVVFAGIAVSL